MTHHPRHTAPLHAREGTPPERALTVDEIRKLCDLPDGVNLIGWASRVRREQRALDELLNGDPGPSKVVPFGRRSSAVGVR